MKKERTHKRFWLNPALVIIVFLAVLIGIYIVVRFLGMLSQTIETVTVNKMTAYESFSGTGWLIREEEIIRNTNSENVKHLVSNGDKVGAGAVLAEVYSNAAAMEYAKQLDAFDNNIVLWKTAMQSAGNYSDAAKVDQMIQNQLVSLSILVEDGICTQLAEYAQELRQLSLRRNAATLDSKKLQSEIDSLVSQRNTLALRIEQQTTEIVSKNSGFFSEVVDGYEAVLNYDKVSDLTAAEFERLIQVEPKKSQNSFGKIVKGFSWCMAMVVPAEDAANLSVGQNVTLRFGQISQDIKATIEQINTDEDAEQVLLLLRSHFISNELLTNRKLNVEVILKSHTGLKVPTSAVYLKGNEESGQQLGVYILTGATARFKEISPIYKGENYYIVTQESSDKVLVAGDNVIVRGLNLSDGKALK